MKNMRVCLSQVREYHSAYDNKYGAPSEGKPKVFVKYFYVNTARAICSHSQCLKATKLIDR